MASRRGRNKNKAPRWVPAPKPVVENEAEKTVEPISNQPDELTEEPVVKEDTSTIENWTQKATSFFKSSDKDDDQKKA